MDNDEIDSEGLIKALLWSMLAGVICLSLLGWWVWEVLT